MLLLSEKYRDIYPDFIHFESEDVDQQDNIDFTDFCFDLIIRSPSLSFYYALEISGIIFHEGGPENVVPFPEGEQAIAKSDHYAYSYASIILKGRFLLGEPAIAKCAFNSMMYAQYVLKGRFPLGEPAIATSDYASKGYTLFLHEDFILDGKLICSIEDAKANRYASKTITSLNRIPA